MHTAIRGITRVALVTSFTTGVAYASHKITMKVLKLGIMDLLSDDEIEDFHSKIMRRSAAAKK